VVRILQRQVTSWDELADRTFRGLAQGATWLILLLLAFILWSIGGKAWMGIRDHGLAFLTSTTWDVGKQQFGVLPQIWGTLYSSLLALLVGGFFGVVMAIFLTQDFLPPRLAQVFRTAPLLFTALFSSYWLFENGQPRLMQPTASLAVLIYNFSGWIRWRCAGTSAWSSSSRTPSR
jgi:ABC-type phosphate transport system permease subunit